MKIRYALAVAVFAAALVSACVRLPTASDPHRSVAAPLHDTTPPDTTSRGGGTIGNGN